MKNSNLHFCAWCQRYFDAAGNYVTPVEALDLGGDLTLSHGMCDECATAFSQLYFESAPSVPSVVEPQS